MRAAAVFALLLVLAGSRLQAAETGRLVFAGDVMLAREVAHEVALSRGASPWSALPGLIAPGDFAMANFEAAVGNPAGCDGGTARPCFAVAPPMLASLAAAGFGAVSLANNHAGDLGDAGRAQTEEALRAAGIEPLDFAGSPGFLRLGDATIGIVAIDLIPGRDGRSDPVPSLDAERRLRLARTLADWVVVFIHWGAELRDWPQPDQRVMAEFLVDHGADLVIGSHPHVVIAPDCVHGRPVFYSLGNHVFDQKYPATRRGLLADCRVADGRLACGSIATETPAGSSFPRLADRQDPAEGLARCSAPRGAPLVVDSWRIRGWSPPGRLTAGPVVLEGSRADGAAWRLAPRRILSVEAGRIIPGDPAQLVTLERHDSAFDHADDPRPYVYRITEHGLAARWRGTALAWPLIDVRLMAGQSGDTLLCALHRTDSFLELDPTAAGTRTASYRWSGFGFRNAADAAAERICAELYRPA
jgi:poly-gamma-glutamate synthesis protein (capsule biosynthesis protein)